MMIPKTIINPERTDQTGKDWFEQQNEGLQRKLMGNAKFEAWKNGKFDFERLTGTHTDEVYGDMRVEMSLKQILGEG